MTQLLFVFLLACVEGVSAAETSLTGKQILEKMVAAMATSNYQGTVVFLKNDKLEAMKYFHSHDKNKEQERLVSLNSPPREIVRNSDEIKCLYKLTRQVIVDHKPYEHSFIVDVPKNLDEMDASYQFNLVGEEDVAMLPAYMVAIQPKDDLRYARKIWVAKDLFLPVKAVVYNLTGAVLEQVVFTEININPNQVKTIMPSSEPEIRSTIQAGPSAEDYSHAAFEVSTLPQGFKQIFFTRKPLHESGPPVDHLLLSDGFATVSVYLEPKKANTSSESMLPEGLHSVGAVNSLSRAIADSQLTVLGEVPTVTVKTIAEGVKLRNAVH